MILIRIIQGWFYYFFKNEKIEQVASKRSTICLSCPKAQFYSATESWNHHQFNTPKDPNKMFCFECGCPISKKIRSPKETCPLKKW